MAIHRLRSISTDAFASDGSESSAGTSWPTHIERTPAEDNSVPATNTCRVRAWAPAQFMAGGWRLGKRRVAVTVEQWLLLAGVTF